MLKPEVFEIVSTVITPAWTALFHALTFFADQRKRRGEKLAAAPSFHPSPDYPLHRVRVKTDPHAPSDPATYDFDEVSAPRRGLERIHHALARYERMNGANPRKHTVLLLENKGKEPRSIRASCVGSNALHGVKIRKVSDTRQSYPRAREWSRPDKSLWALIYPYREAEADEPVTIRLDFENSDGVADHHLYQLIPERAEFRRMSPPNI